MMEVYLLILLKIFDEVTVQLDYFGRLRLGNSVLHTSKV